MDLLDTLARQTCSRFEEGVLTLAPPVGQGSIRWVDVGPDLTMLIAQCELTTDLAFNRKATRTESGALTFSFRNVFSPLGEGRQSYVGVAHIGRVLPSVQVSSDAVDVDLFFPAHMPINTILITASVDVVRQMLRQSATNPLLNGLLTRPQPLLYEELLSVDIQQAASQLVAAPVPQPLHAFYGRVKAQELICLLFADLLKRQDTVSYPINGADIQRMYQLRDALLSDLSQPPNIPALAVTVGMSESKMKRLFKQIFGSSIYTYYQDFRMKEAAYLIREQRLSITDAGLRLGFTNLSHFTRIFERHLGQKPKKYSRSLLSAP